jgi:hypothetical protein
MKHVIELTKQEFESSSQKTPEYLAWLKLFKKEFTQFLMDKYLIDKSDILIGKPNHFDVSGFFKYFNQYVYFSISDLRWSKNEMLIRTAKDTKDYTGGTNNCADFTDYDKFSKQFDSFMSQIRRNHEIRN